MMFDTWCFEFETPITTREYFVHSFPMYAKIYQQCLQINANCQILLRLTQEKTTLRLQRGICMEIIAAKPLLQCSQVYNQTVKRSALTKIFLHSGILKGNCI